MNIEQTGFDIPITTSELAALASGAFHEQLVEGAIFKSCLNCENFVEDGSFCKHYKRIPPAKVIVFSCKSKGYKQKIPF